MVAIFDLKGKKSKNGQWGFSVAFKGKGCEYCLYYKARISPVVSVFSCDLQKLRHYIYKIYEMCGKSPRKNNVTTPR